MLSSGSGDRNKLSSVASKDDRRAVCSDELESLGLVAALPKKVEIDCCFFTDEFVCEEAGSSGMSA